MPRQGSRAEWPMLPRHLPVETGVSKYVLKVSFYWHRHVWLACGTYLLIGPLTRRASVSCSATAFSRAAKRLAALPGQFSISTQTPWALASLQVGFPAHQFVHRIASVLLCPRRSFFRTAGAWISSCFGIWESSSRKMALREFKAPVNYETQQCRQKSGGGLLDCVVMLILVQRRLSLFSRISRPPPSIPSLPPSATLQSTKMTSATTMTSWTRMSRRAIAASRSGPRGKRPSTSTRTCCNCWPTARLMSSPLI